MMYIYLLTILAQNLKNVQAIASPHAKNDLLACMLALLRNIPSEYLLQYLSSTDSRIDRHNRAAWFDAFTDLLKEALICFEFQGGKEQRRDVALLNSSPGKGILSSAAQAALLSDDPNPTTPATNPVALGSPSAAGSSASPLAASMSPSAAASASSSSLPVLITAQSLSVPAPSPAASPASAANGASTPSAASAGTTDSGAPVVVVDNTVGAFDPPAGSGVRRNTNSAQDGVLNALESRYAHLAAESKPELVRRGTATEEPDNLPHQSLRDKRRVQSRNFLSRSLKRGMFVGGVGVANSVGANSLLPPASGMTLRRVSRLLVSKEDRLQRMERAFAAEVAHTILDFAIQVLIPFSHHTLVGSEVVQDKLLRFLYTFMVTNQSNHVLTRLFMFMSRLTSSYSVHLWTHSMRVHDAQRYASEFLFLVVWLLFLMPVASVFCDVSVCQLRQMVVRNPASPDVPGRCRARVAGGVHVPIDAHQLGARRLAEPHACAVVRELCVRV
jgi:hypothetical protein